MSRLANALLGASALLFAGCATPLGPGYQIDQQQVELRYSAGKPDPVRVRAVYRLRNAGNTALDSVETQLPAGAQSLRITVEGAPVTREAVAQAPELAVASLAKTFVVRFSPPWPMKKERSLVVEYELSVPHADAFYLGARSWFPELVPPEKAFARGTARGKKVDVRIGVPEGWRVLCAGRARGTKTRNGETESRFLLREDDFPPFVVAGRYHEQVVTTADGTVIFWSFSPLDRLEAQAAGAPLLKAMKFYERTFGPRQKRQRPVWIAEQGRDGSPSQAVAEVNPSAHSFPDGVLVNQAAAAGGLAAEGSLQLAKRELARIWFFHLARPASEPALVFERLFAERAVMLADAGAERIATGREAWNRAVLEFISRYDSARQGISEKPFVALTAEDGPGQSAVAYYKAALFLVALEEHLGWKGMDQALRRMIQARRGQDWNLNDLRSALEAESGQNLGEFIRTWLAQPGIPEEFRKRYASP